MDLAFLLHGKKRKNLIGLTLSLAKLQADHVAGVSAAVQELGKNNLSNGVYKQLLIAVGKIL